MTTRTMRKLCGLVIAAATSAALPLTAGEVASNGGFEYGTLITTPWNGLSGGGFSIIRGNARSGNYCLRYQATTPPTYKVPHQSVTASVGQTYRGSVWVKTENLIDGEAVICIEWSDTNDNWMNGVYQNPGSSVSGTKDWTRIRVQTPRLPANVGKVTLGVYVRDGSIGTAYFDDASLELLDASAVEGLYSSAYRNRAADGDVMFVADLNLPVAGLSPSGVTGEFVVPLAAGGTQTLAASTLLDDRATVTIPVSTLATGTVTFKLKQNGSVVASKTLQLTKLASEPSTGVRIDRRRHMIVNGQPFFPVGMYWMGVTTSELPAYAAVGFNFLMPYARLSVAQLDACQANGLKAFYTLQNFYPFHQTPSAGIVDDATAEARVREHVALVKDHPALLGWYTNDETGPEHAEALTERSTPLNSIAPDHPVWIVVSQYDRMQAYMPTFDICGTDPYPSGASSYPKVYDYPARQMADSFGIRPLIEAIAITQNDTFLPTAGEIRSMTWLALCAGAEGVCYYSYHDIRNGNGGETFEQRFAAVGEVAAELRRYEDVVLSDEEPIAASVEGSSDIVCRTWKKGGNTYLAVANKTWNTVSGTVRFGESFSAMQTLIGENQTLSGNAVSVSLPSKGVSFLALRDPSANEWRPEVVNVRMSQAENGTVRVDYELRFAPAVVTLDILTNAMNRAGMPAQ